MAGSAWTNQVQNQVIIAGPSGQLLVYSPSPGTNNLIYSVSGAAFTDRYGNQVLQGATSYGLVSGNFVAYQVLNGSVTLYDGGTLGTETGTWNAGGTFGGASGAVSMDTGVSLTTPVQFAMASATAALQAPNVSGFNGVNFVPGQGWLAQINGVNESWHTLTISGTGLSAGSPAPAYKLYPDNTVSVQGEVNATSGTTSGTFATLPAGYRPLSTKKYAVPISAGTPAVAANAQITINSSGTIQLSAGPTGAAYSFALDVARFPLDQ